MQKTYCVAHHSFVVEAPDSLFAMMDQYAPFQVDGTDSPVFTLEVVQSLPECTRELIYDQPTEPGETKICLYRCEHGIIARVRITSSHPVAGEILMSEDYTAARLHICEKADALFALNNALMLMYAFSTAQMGTLEMHASVIMNGGKGYLFLAKSGTGKSTQSRMWLENIEGSVLLNDDNPIVRVHEDGSIVVYGSPWSGKTPCYKNISCPVGAFVQISRSPENRITPLNALSSYAIIYSSCSGFKAERKMSDGLHKTIEALVLGSRCFVLDCRPDAQAAQVCAEGVR